MSLWRIKLRERCAKHAMYKNLNVDTRKLESSTWLKPPCHLMPPKDFHTTMKPRYSSLTCVNFSSFREMLERYCQSNISCHLRPFPWFLLFDDVFVILSFINAFFFILSFGSLILMLIRNVLRKIHKKLPPKVTSPEN